jgi:pimeloyl-ACP methyl ester carboxylesterase
MASAREDSRLWPFVAGVLAGGAGAVLAAALLPRRRLDPRLIRASRHDPSLPTTVIVPGILGSQLLRPDGTDAWLNLGNALGYHDLGLPLALPLAESRDDLLPGPLLGTDRILPRMFGFTEYADVVELLEDAGFLRDRRLDTHPEYRIFSYDWRRDLVEAARALHEMLTALAAARHDPHARFNLIGHSMGGLVARYYLRYGTAEPSEDAPVTWAGAQRIENLVLVAVPNGGSIHSFEAILNGNRVGFSYTTLAAPVIARMPSIYQLLPPEGTTPLVDDKGDTVAASLLDPATWEQFGWGPYHTAGRRYDDDAEPSGDDAEPSGRDAAKRREFLAAALARARAFHHALARRPDTRCPARVILLGGDCLPTLGRALVARQAGLPPRFVPRSEDEAAAMMEAGDGRVTRASVLAAHLPEGDDSDTGGLPEVSQAFFGSADHHGIYREPTFQSILLRLLLRPSRPRLVEIREGRTA